MCATVTRRTAAVIALTTAWRTTTAITLRRALTALTGWAGITWRPRCMLARFVIMGALVGVDRRRVVRVVFRVIFGYLLLFASADDAFQAGFEAAEQRGFFRGVVGAAGGGHKRFRRDGQGLSAILRDNANPQTAAAGPQSFIA